jgi:RNA exonuclease 4
VLGLAHPNSHIRDVALYVPFRNTLGSLDQIVRLPTMMWMLMRRRIGESTHHPVGVFRCLIYLFKVLKIIQAEDARAVIDLFRSVESQWEGYIDQLVWPCYLPPNS